MLRNVRCVASACNRFGDNSLASDCRRPTSRAPPQSAARRCSPRLESLGVVHHDARPAAPDRSTARRPSGASPAAASCKLGPVHQALLERLSRRRRAATVSTPQPRLGLPQPESMGSPESGPRRHRRRRSTSATGPPRFRSRRRAGRSWCGGATMSAPMLATSASPTGQKESRAVLCCSGPWW